MIIIGATEQEKALDVQRYVSDHGIVRVFSFGPSEFAVDLRLDVPHEHIAWPDIIRYVFYYRLLQEIDSGTLLVINECLRTQNRNDLTYNCLRNFLNQTTHQIVFQRLPIIDTQSDFATLFDLDTRSRWKLTKEDELPLDEAVIELRRCLAPLITASLIQATSKAHEAYRAKREKLFAELGLRDPHTLPRNLHLVGGKTRLRGVDGSSLYVARNKRLRRDNICAYADVKRGSQPRAVIDWPHRFLVFSDFLARTGQVNIQAITTDIKVDQWYLCRYQDWAKRVKDACATLHG